MADKITSLEQHLDYEAIIQIAEIDDQDLLYLNFDNQALGESRNAGTIQIAGVNEQELLYVSLAR